ncbi:Fe-S cluster assembly protein SufB [Candidatus Gottesmanbacteria bacterium]|nr:Fe-S cluster assembly protein SufB [Candidatus Gottesmanbacteria bacterium]
MQSLIDDSYKYGFHKPEKYVFKSKKGLDRTVVEEISSHKSEPAWMREFRLKSLSLFEQKPLPVWGGDLTTIDFDNIYYYIKPMDKKVSKWDELPPDIKDTYDKIGIPEAEKKFLAGVSAQYESEVVYKSIQSMLTKKGVIFLDMDSGLRQYPDIVRQYFGTVIPAADNKFAALNSSVWSGGSFVYVPKGVRVELPLQAYFRINAANMGQFERTLIIAEEGSFVHYVEGCLPAGEQVSLCDRWVNIESVKPKDLVVGDDGREHRVKAIMTRDYSGDLISIHPVSPYNKFRLTPEHPVLAIKRSGVGGRRRYGWLSEVSSKKLLKCRPSYYPAGELKRGDFLVFPKVQIEREARMNVDEVKLLGYYLAEGSTYIHKTLNRPIVSFSCNELEKSFYEEIATLIKKITGKRAMIIHDRKKHGMEVRVYSSLLRDLCLAHCGKGAATKVLSKEIMSLPLDQIRTFVDAYWRGDGNVLKRQGSTLMRAATVSEGLARQLQVLCGCIGIYLSIQIRRGGADTIGGRRIHRQTQYILVYTPNKKWTKMRETNAYFLVPIEHISREPYKGLVFNLDVVGVNSYLVRGFAVHNCTAPIYTTDSLHSAVVEIIVKKGARVRYTTIQNWSKNVYNLVTKRARVEEEGVMEWVDGNLGSKLTMKYPSVYLVGRKARGEILSIAYAGSGQHQDAGGKAIHAASETSSQIISKSISRRGGRTSYRGLVQVYPGAKGVKSKVVCDALLLDEASRSDTYPTMKVDEQDVQMEHEATVSKIGDEQMFYVTSRGITKAQAQSMIINGFIEPIVKELPLEYAVEMNRLIELQMQGSVG